MSLFRRPKKPMQRRVFGADDDDSADDTKNGAGGSHDQSTAKQSTDDVIDVDAAPATKERRSDKKPSKDATKINKKPSLLSFGDEDEEGEVFQVKKTSQSKKVMKMMDKERRKKKSGRDKDEPTTARHGSESSRSRHDGDDDDPYGESGTKGRGDKSDKYKRNDAGDGNKHTEIRTDDFVLVVKQSGDSRSISADTNAVLNGRAALCAGRDDMSSEDDELADKTRHRFTRPDNFRTVLESGAIPDAAMIHEARKKRQKAREQGDFIELEEKKPSKTSTSRLVREEDDDDDDQSDEERVDMNAITGAKEREERREKFYSMQQELSGEETDPDMDEWENQQIRKGVTGAQLISAQQESVYAQYMIKQPAPQPMTTKTLLEQAYAHSALEKPRRILLADQKSSQPSNELRKPAQILAAMQQRVAQVRELHEKHLADIEDISRDIKLMKMQELECEQNAPLAAGKFRFFQDFRGYVADLVECLDEKVPKVVELERRMITCISKQANALIERRRQDVRDQSKEIAQIGKPTLKGNPNEEEERIRRVAEREGRRTRRRRDRERIDIKNSHLDGMSSDEEIPDQEAAAFRSQLKLIDAEAANVFEDVTDDFSQISNILKRFEAWRIYDMESYKDTYVSLCLPKILGPIVRLSMITWNPLDEKCRDIDTMDWYETVMCYAYATDETEQSLQNDPDVRLMPSIIEKIILPKITELIETSWDPLSTTKTVALVRIIRRFEQDYPTLHPGSRYTRACFTAVLDKMKNAMDNDVFIPIFPKQHQEGKSSFFQRQFSSALKLLYNILRWQDILSDVALRDIAIASLLNRYLLSALRVCSLNDACGKAYTILNTLPVVWLQSGSNVLESLTQFRAFVNNLSAQLDSGNPAHGESIGIVNQMLSRLHNTSQGHK